MHRTTRTMPHTVKQNDKSSNHRGVTYCNKWEGLVRFPFYACIAIVQDCGMLPIELKLTHASCTSKQGPVQSATVGVSAAASAQASIASTMQQTRQPTAAYKTTEGDLYHNRPVCADALGLHLCCEDITVCLQLYRSVRSILVYPILSPVYEDGA